MESQKGSMVSIAKSGEISMHRLRSNYNSRTNNHKEAIINNALQNITERYNSPEDPQINMSRDAAHTLNDIGFEQPEYH